MATPTREIEQEQDALLSQLAEACSKLPDGPLPITPTTTRALAQLIAAVYGDALRELEKH